MSEFTVPLVCIGKIDKHPNADTLSITEVEGCPVIFRTGDFQMSQYAIYVPIEAVVPTTNPAFSFLATKEGQTTHRIKAKKLRGIFSMGLLVKLDVLPPGTPIKTGGEPNDFAEVLGIKKYVEPERNMPLGAGNRERKQPDSSTAPVYDVESFRKYKTVFWDFEKVVATEKIHGCNARFVFRKADDEEAPRLFVGSRNFFNKETEDSIWWKIARKHDLAAKLAKFQDMVLYGEIYGQVQDLKYGTTAEDPIRFAAFDVYDKKLGRYLNYDDFVFFCHQLEIPMAPVLYTGDFKNMPRDLCDGKSLLAPDQMREGFVVKPVVERWDPRLGRVMAKLVGEEYLLRKGGTEYQ